MYRQEHPKPQFQRKNWKNLNGKWDFEMDFSNSGKAKGFFKSDYNYSKKIEVPFCPESKLSGIEFKDFINSVWYKREFVITDEEKKGKVFLHVGACDYLTTAYVNGAECGTHKGGYVSFKFDITDYVVSGKNQICINAYDDTRSRLIPSGKQSEELNSFGPMYTRTTGIWQTVWLEFCPTDYIEKVKITPSADTQSVVLELALNGTADLYVKSSYKGKDTGSAELKNAHGNITLTLPLSEKHLWDIGKGELYDLDFVFGTDAVHSYFGLRKIEYKDMKFYLNGKSVFQRLVLDQGFYPEGIYTAPSDEDLKGDITRSMEMGFNGARLHEKIFEERFLYHCDKAGYLVWGEYPNWGLDISYPDSIYGIMNEWIEELNRDYNHPSIVGWCPFNETWDTRGRAQNNDVLECIYRLTKAIDPARPCIDTSGNYHVITDIYDVHEYFLSPEELRKSFESLEKDGTYTDKFEPRQNYKKGEPFFVSEYGGIAWNKANSGWGYGDNPMTEEDFLARLKGITDAILDNSKIFGFCYTQLTDVEQEQNGLYYYNREPKFDQNKISKIFQKKAAIED